MAFQIKNAIVPDRFAGYVAEELATKMTLITGGAIQPDPVLDTLASGGGRAINMPFWKNLAGDDEILSDTVPLNPDDLESGQDVAALIARGKAWKVNDLEDVLSGGDPVGNLVAMIADFQAIKLQQTLIAELKGVRAENEANNGGDMVYNVAVEEAANVDPSTQINAGAVIRAAATMGDKLDSLTMIVLHSAVYTVLQTLNQIVWVDENGNIVSTPQNAAPSDGKRLFPTYLGLRVLVDDGVPVRSGSTSGTVYTSFLIGDGGIGYGNGRGKNEFETDRDSLQGDDVIISRWYKIVHPRGNAFQFASVAGATPTNAEFELATNWKRVYNRKNVKLAFLDTN